jgi:hypothetical protein
VKTEGKMNDEEIGEDEVTSCVDMRIQKTREVLAAKAGMYATANNRLHNFDFAARLLNCTPEQALQGMMVKHIVSVFDLIRWTETDPQNITTALIDEKIGDTINYMILLESLLLRRLKRREEDLIDE